MVTGSSVFEDKSLSVLTDFAGAGVAIRAFATDAPRILHYITIALQISESSVLFMDKTAISGGDGYNCIIDDECLSVFEQLTINDNLFIPSGLYNHLSDEKVANFVIEKNIVTFMVSRIVISKKIFGYVILFEDKVSRIWQEKEALLLLYLNKVIELLYNKKAN